MSHFSKQCPGNILFGLQLHLIVLNPDYKQTNKNTKELHVWETKDQQEAAPGDVKGSQKIRDGLYGSVENSDLVRNKTDDVGDKIQDGSYGPVKQSDLARNKMDDRGDKQGKIHEDYTLKQRAPASEDGLTKETWGEYLLRIFGGTVLVFVV